MSQEHPFVALVGRPNVGKSRLFNRLARRRIAIVHDQPGVTRDVVAHETPGGITLMDTGGLGLEDPEKALVEATAQRVFFAVSTADLILFLVDGKTGLNPSDQDIANQLRRAGKPVWLIVNKIDREEDESIESEFTRLGFGEIYPVSAEHGRGVDQLWEDVQHHFFPDGIPEVEKGPRRVRVCFAGRPNVGKSSLANSLLESEQLIVSDIPGTTRDTVEWNLDFTSKRGESWPFRLIDTAGLRKKTRISTSVEYFSSVRSRDALTKADVVFLVLDAMEGVSKQDKSLVNAVEEAGRGLVVLVNKWDLALERIEAVEEDPRTAERKFRETYMESVKRELFPFGDAPIIFVSAKESWEMERMLRAARSVERNQTNKLPTGQLNRVMMKILEKQPPVIRGNHRFKVYYAVQTGVKPLRLRLFCNRAERLEENYRKYLLRELREHFSLVGCPLRIETVGKEPRFEKSSG